MNDWNIHPRAHACQACNQPFGASQPYHTVLFDEKSDYHRMDVCESCWTAQYGQGATDRKGFISHWQGIYELPPATPPDPIKKETAETLLRKLTEQNDPQYRAASYILAVMLERKRLLKIKAQSTQDGQRVFVYEQPKTGDLFTIPDPNLKLGQLDEVQHQVARLLEHGLNPPAPMPDGTTGAEIPREVAEAVAATAAPAGEVTNA